jgi:hypothetical protein
MHSLALKITGQPSGRLQLRQAEAFRKRKMTILANIGVRKTLEKR